MLIATDLVTHSTKAALQSIPEITSIIGIGLLSTNYVHLATNPKLLWPVYL